jgi:ATP adenylyltransferase
MYNDLLHRIDCTLDRATVSGALQPIRTEHTLIRDGDIDFTVRWVSSLAHKDAARVRAAVHRDPDFNPFLPPDPELTVGALGELHLGVLNKFPVIERHLLIVTRAFDAQTAPLTRADFIALATVMHTLGGLGFYNGGSEAGASQRHKHLQWIPEAGEGVALEAFTRGLPTHLPAGALTVHPALPWHHCFVRLTAEGPSDGEQFGDLLHDAFRRACATLDIDTERDPLPPYNLLASRDWLTVIPRRCEHHRHISVNALGFAGSLFVRHPEQIEMVRAIGPLQLLTAVAHPR